MRSTAVQRQRNSATVTRTSSDYSKLVQASPAMVT